MSYIRVRTPTQLPEAAQPESESTNAAQLTLNTIYLEFPPNHDPLASLTIVVSSSEGVMKKIIWS